jgi:hypothetical protein
MFKTGSLGRWWVAAWLCVFPAQASAGCLLDDASPGAQGRFTIHLSASCSQVERNAHAVKASAILAALTRGQIVDLDGVVIHGDLALETLPVVSVPPVIDGIIGPHDQEVRVIAGGLSVVNSTVQGRIVHRSADGTLVFSGPVTFRGTAFEQMIDLSRSVFTHPVVLSGAVFLAEGYFVQSQFLGEVTGEKTAFGPHTRFHRSRFHRSVTFEQSGFSGLAEFLEVRFDRDANLARTYFKLGTGFSGSQFTGLAATHSLPLPGSMGMPISVVQPFGPLRTLTTRNSTAVKIFPRCFSKRGRNSRERSVPARPKVWASRTPKSNMPSPSPSSSSAPC